MIEVLANTVMVIILQYIKSTLYLKSAQYYMPIIPFFFFWPHYIACRILVPQSETEPRSLAMKIPSPNHWTARKFPFISKQKYISQKKKKRLVKVPSRVSGMNIICFPF